MTSAEENAVLQRGLRSLPETRLKQLLSVPEKLLEIQQAVLERGGSYWSSVANKSLQSDSIKQRLQTTLGNVMKSDTPNRTSNSTAQVALPISTKETNQSGWIQHATWAAIGSLVTAATILLVVRPAALFPTNTIAQNSNQSVTTTDAGWGFEKFASTIDETTEKRSSKVLEQLGLGCRRLEEQKTNLAANTCSTTDRISCRLFGDHACPASVARKRFRLVKRSMW